MSVIPQRAKPLSVIVQRANPLSVILQRANPLSVILQRANPLSVILQRAKRAGGSAFLLFVLSAISTAQNPQPAGRGGGRGNGRRAVEVMKLSTTAWQDGGAIPPKYAQPGRDVSPALTWSPGPEGTASFVLIAHDLDAATGNGVDDMLHWLVWNIPKEATSLLEGVPQSPQRPDGSRQISASGPYYRGPAAPSTGPTHHYVFEIFALDTLIDVPSVGVQPGPTRTAVMAAMAGHVRGKGAIVGTFKRSP